MVTYDFVLDMRQDFFVVLFLQHRTFAAVVPEMSFSSSDDYGPGEAAEHGGEVSGDAGVALVSAARDGDLSAVKHLIEDKLVDPNVSTEIGTPLVLACFHGRKK